MLTLSVVCLGASVTLSECNWATSSQQAVGLQLLFAPFFVIVGIRSAHPRGRKYELEPIRNTSYMAMNALWGQPVHTTCKRPNHLTTRADRPTDRPTEGMAERTDEFATEHVRQEIARRSEHMTELVRNCKRTVCNHRSRRMFWKPNWC